MAYEKEYTLAKEIAKEVGEYILTEQQGGISRVMKKDKTLVTRVDVAAEKKIMETIKNVFPNDVFLTEETKTENTQKRDRLWIIDPIDGTSQFSFQEDNFCVMIAFMDNNDVQFGVFYQPVKDRLVHAKKGAGAFCNKNKIQPTTNEDLSQLYVISCLFYYAKNNKLEHGLAEYGRVLKQCHDIMRYGSAGIDIFRVASGRAAAYYEAGVKPWDIAAPKVILEEAGGIISNMDGSPLDLFRREDGKWCLRTLASANRSIHEQMVTAIMGK